MVHILDISLFSTDNYVKPYNEVIMTAIASQITSLTIVYSTVDSDAEQREHQSSVSLAFVWGIHRGPVNSPHKWPVTRKMFPFDDVIMISHGKVLYPRHFSVGITICHKHNTKETVLFGASMPLLNVCVKTVYNVTAKMLWPRSLGGNGRKSFVTIELICRATRCCIMEICILFFAICRGRHFENGLVGVKYGQIFIAKIIISHKYPARISKVWVFSCLRLYQLFRNS